MNNPILRGYAIPFSSPALLVDGISEVIQPGTFRAQIEQNRRCRLIFGSHDADAPELASDVTLFETPHGLAFEAEVNLKLHDRWMLRAIASGRHDKCSVFFESRNFHLANFGGMRDVQHVTNAEIEHIAVMSGYVSYGAGSGVWLADHPISGTNHRLQLLAERWEAASLDGASIRHQPSDDEEPRYQELLKLTAKSRQRALVMFKAAMQNQSPSDDHELADDADDLTLVTALLKRHKARITDLEARLADMEAR